MLAELIKQNDVVEHASVSIRRAGGVFVATFGYLPATGEDRHLDQHKAVDTLRAMQAPLGLASAVSDTSSRPCSRG